MPNRAIVVSSTSASRKKELNWRHGVARVVSAANSGHIAHLRTLPSMAKVVSSTSFNHNAIVHLITLHKLPKTCGNCELTFSQNKMAHPMTMMPRRLRIATVVSANHIKMAYLIWLYRKFQGHGESCHRHNFRHKELAHLMTLPKIPSTATVVSATPSNQNKMAASVGMGPTVRNQIWTIGRQCRKI